MALRPVPARCAEPVLTAAPRPAGCSARPLVLPVAALMGTNLSRLAALMAAAGSGGLPAGLPAVESGSLSWSGAAFPATEADLPRPPARGDRNQSVLSVQ